MKLSLLIIGVLFIVQVKSQQYNEGGYSSSSNYGASERPRVNLGISLKVPAMKINLGRMSMPKISIRAKIKPSHEPKIINVPEMHIDTNSKIPAPEGSKAAGNKNQDYGYSQGHQETPSYHQEPSYGGMTEPQSQSYSQVSFDNTHQPSYGGGYSQNSNSQNDYSAPPQSPSYSQISFDNTHQAPSYGGQSSASYNNQQSYNNQPSYNSAPSESYPPAMSSYQQPSYSGQSEAHSQMGVSFDNIQPSYGGYSQSGKSQNDYSAQPQMPSYNQSPLDNTYNTQSYYKQSSSSYHKPTYGKAESYFPTPKLASPSYNQKPSYGGAYSQAPMPSSYQQEPSYGGGYPQASIPSAYQQEPSYGDKIQTYSPPKPSYQQPSYGGQSDSYSAPPQSPTFIFFDNNHQSYNKKNSYGNNDQGYTVISAKN